MKLSKNHTKWLIVFVTAMPLGAIGYFVGGYVSNPDLWDSMRTSLGIDELAILNVPTLIAAGIFIFLSLLQGVLLCIARFSRPVSQITGIEAQFGDGKKGRLSFLPLAWFHSANGMFLALLACLTFQQLTGHKAILSAGVGLVCGTIMVFSARRCWQLLDELVRQIWVEATALSCGITLLIGMFVGLGASLKIIEPATTLQAILAYNYIYLFVYMAITAARAPETFTDPNLEAK